MSMIKQGLSHACGVAVVSWGLATAQAAEPPQFRDLFNGKDLSGWVNVNTAATPGPCATACWSAAGTRSA